MCEPNTYCLSYIKRLLTVIFIINVITSLIGLFFGMYVMFEAQKLIDKHKYDFDDSYKDLKNVKTVLEILGLNEVAANKTIDRLENLKLQRKF